jgi:ParB-like chromosome segregation protein Spo0J
MKKLVTKLKAIKELVYDPNNAREHGDKNLEYIKGSLTKFGQQKPIVITEDGVVVAGNGTLEAAKDLGWEKINVVETKLDPMLQTAYALADNRTNETSEWNKEILAQTLQSLREEDFELGDIGFDIDSLVDMDMPPEIPDFKASDEEQPRLDKVKLKTCPSCGFEYE